MYLKLKIMYMHTCLQYGETYDKQDAVRFNMQDNRSYYHERFYSTRLLHYSMCNCVWTSHRELYSHTGTFHLQEDRAVLDLD